MALDFILWRLGSLKTTIEVNQFFPRAYFSQQFSVERTFDPENSETYITLRDFTKKYASKSQEEQSWAVHTAVEVEAFQTYDALDFKKYLNLKLGSREEEGSAESSYRTEKSSSDSTLGTSVGTTTSAYGTAKVPLSAAGKGMNGCSPSGTREKPAFNTLSNPEDQISIKSSISYNAKSKLKAVVTFGLKKRSGAFQSAMKGTGGRTKASSEKQNVPVGGK